MDKDVANFAKFFDKHLVVEKGTPGK
jgi:hypothetical protein